MFLIRTAFWLSLVILLLPLGNQNNSNVIGVTADAISNMDRFCDRNRDICSITQEAWKSLKFKAAYSFDALANISREIKDQAKQTSTPDYNDKTQSFNDGNLETGNVDKNGATHNIKSYRSGNNTLTKNDLMPGWSLTDKKTGKQPSI